MYLHSNLHWLTTKSFESLNLYSVTIFCFYKVYRLYKLLKWSKGLPKDHLGNTDNFATISFHPDLCSAPKLCWRSSSSSTFKHCLFILSPTSFFPFTVPVGSYLASQKTLRCGQTTVVFITWQWSDVSHFSKGYFHLSGYILISYMVLQWDIQ